jgi:hypothetical protein
MKTLPYKKRILAILSIVGIFLVTSDQIFSMIQVQKIESKKSLVTRYIQSQKPDISPDELEDLASAIIHHAPRLELALGSDSVQYDKTILLMAIIQTESSFKKTARSKKNARGYMQLLPSTATWMSEKEGIQFETKNIHVAETNISIGVNYMNYLLSNSSNLREATLAYNAGPTAVKKWGGVPKYWDTIESYYNEIEDFQTRGDHL